MQEKCKENQKMGEINDPEKCEDDACRFEVVMRNTYEKNDEKICDLLE